MVIRLWCGYFAWLDCLFPFCCGFAGAVGLLDCFLAVLVCFHGLGLWVLLSLGFWVDGYIVIVIWVLVCGGFTCFSLLVEVIAVTLVLLVWLYVTLFLPLFRCAWVLRCRAGFVSC